MELITILKIAPNNNQNLQKPFLLLISRILHLVLLYHDLRKKERTVLPIYSILPQICLFYKNKAHINHECYGAGFG